MKDNLQTEVAQAASLNRIEAGVKSGSFGPALVIAVAATAVALVLLGIGLMLLTGGEWR